MKTVSISMLAAAVVLAATPVVAHHSHAMFDGDKELSLNGTVKEFQWTNPHSWILLTVKDETGKDVEWAVEMGNPAMLARKGWRPKSLQPGDQVEITINPLRSGEPGGNLLTLKTADGRSF